VAAAGFPARTAPGYRLNGPRHSAFTPVGRTSGITGPEADPDEEKSPDEAETSE